MANRYSSIIEKIFFNNYSKGASSVTFQREEFEKVAAELNIKIPKNLGDIIYSFRFRNDLPTRIVKLAPEGQEWSIKVEGRSRYSFVLEKILALIPNKDLTFTKILDATPGIIGKYAFTDEQAILAVLRYNRLIDTFLGITCYSLQNHLRTTVPSGAQVETDELYIGLDRRGAHYAVPVQAKGGKDRLGKVQIEQDILLCNARFPNLICVPVAAQFMADGKIALFSFEKIQDGQIRILSERHYKLVPSESLSDEEIRSYIRRTE